MDANSHGLGPNYRFPNIDVDANHLVEAGDRLDGARAKAAA